MTLNENVNSPVLSTCLPVDCFALKKMFIPRAFPCPTSQPYEYNWNLTDFYINQKTEKF